MIPIPCVPVGVIVRFQIRSLPSARTALVTVASVTLTAFLTSSAVAEMASLNSIPIVNAFPLCVAGGASHSAVSGSSFSSSSALTAIDVAGKSRLSA